MQKVKIHSFYSKDLNSNILEIIFINTSKILYLQNIYGIPFDKNTILSFEALFDLCHDKFQSIEKIKNLSKESVQTAIKDMEDLF